jgi:hypothetical protein
VNHTRPCDTWVALQKEEVMRTKAARAFLEGFGTVRSVLEVDTLTVQEIVEAMDEDREDPFLNPWKRGHNAAIRAALGH